MIRILLADEHVLMRSGVRLLLQEMSDVDIVAEADNGVDAVALAAKHLPDIVLMDISLPLLSGLQVIREIKDKFPFINVIILTMLLNETCLEQALRAGATGYLLKNTESADIAHALGAVSRGAMYLGQQASRQLVDSYFSRPLETGKERPAENAAPEIPLTARQREILQLIAEGLTGKQIAQRLGISPKTVEGHRAHLAQRLHIQDVSGLVRYAIRIGLISVDH